MERSKEGGNTIQVFWVAISAFSSIALSLVTSMILSRYFPKEDYGTYRQVIFLYNTLLVVFTAGLPRVFSYYLPRYELKEGKSIVLKLTTLLFVLGVSFSVFLYFSSGMIAYLLNNPDLEYSIKLFSPVPMFLLPTLGIDGVFSTYKKTFQLAVYTSMSKLLMLFILVLPVIFYGVNYEGVIIGWVIASFVTFIFALYFKSLPFRNIKPIKSSLRTKDILAYSLPLLVASIAGISLKSANQFYVSRHFGTDVFADFSNGFIELPFVGMITFSIATVLMPLFSKMVYEKKEISKIIELWQAAIIKSATILYPLVIFFLFFAQETIVLLYSEKYVDSTKYFQIALFSNFFNVIMFAPILLSLGKSKLYSNLLLFFAFFTWIGTFIVLNIWESAVAIAIFSTITTILITLVAFYKTAKILEVSFYSVFPIIRLGKILIHVALCCALVKYISFIYSSNDYLFLNLVVSFSAYLAVIFLSDIYFKINYLSIIKPILGRLKK